MRAFLADELHVYVPEHAPWDVFNHGTWNRALDGDLPERVGDGQSQLSKQRGLPSTIGDWRPPKVLVYDLVSRSVTDRTADIANASPADANRLLTTLGMRAAGSFGGVALLGGPSLNGAINLFAFDTSTGSYLGSTTLTAYGNIRHFLVADGALYAGVGLGVNGASGGRILRWTGSRTDPFAFVEVGDLPDQAADLTVFHGRVFVSTWVPRGTNPDLAGLWMSPPLRSDGLTTVDATNWHEVWSVSRYEPDPLVATTYNVGALATYDGYLYWGTMHVPFQADFQFQAAHPPTSQAEATADAQDTQRATVLFRGRDFGTDRQKVGLLYGESTLPAFDPGTNAWQPTSTRYTPLYGASGFGNAFNNYTWTMGVAAGRLYVGTMDWSFIAHDLIPARPVDPAGFGADLWTFRSSAGPATAVDTTGLGNYLNYGIRTMVTDGTTLYLGMADPMNLRTDPSAGPEGGWELIQLDTR